VLAVAMPFVHVEPHDVVALAYAHSLRRTPSHVPPHVVPPPVQASREACGAPATAEHVPRAPGTSHASHCPLHAALQHTPSAHTPLAHSLAAVQAAPFVPFATQAPCWQCAADVQSMSEVHVVGHDPPAHT
jgi:hypothetical protein